MTRHGTRGAYSRGCRCLPCTGAGMASRRRGLPDGDARHGTTNGYGNYGCRCEECCAANTAKVREEKAKRASQVLLPDDPRHGTSNAYGNWSCRCEDCRAAATRDSYITNLRRRTRAAR